MIVFVKRFDELGVEDEVRFVAGFGAKEGEDGEGEEGEVLADEFGEGGG